METIAQRIDVLIELDTRIPFMESTLDLIPEERRNGLSVAHTFGKPSARRIRADDRFTANGVGSAGLACERYAFLNTDAVTACINEGADEATVRRIFEQRSAGGLAQRRRSVSTGTRTRPVAGRRFSIHP